MPNERLKILQVISNLEIGGGQEVVRTLAPKLAELDCVSVVCTFQDGPLRQEIEAAGIPVEILPARRHSVVALPLFIAEMLRLRRALLDVADKYEINVIQTHLLRVMDFLVLSLKLSRDVAVFWTFHNALFTLRREHLPRYPWLLGPKQAAFRMLYRATARWVNGYVAISDGVREAVLNTFGAVAGKVVVISNCVDVQRYTRPVDRAAIRSRLGLPADAQVAALVATFKTQKGHRYLIEAAPAVVARFPQLHILLIGDGELHDELIALAAAAGMADHIHFLGLRQDIPDLLAASDCFVLPSLWEGLPMALIEAMAAGLPVIATAVSGSQEVIVDGESGLLIPPADVPALEAALLRLLSEPEYAARLGQAAQTRVDLHFGAGKQAAEYLALYQRELPIEFEPNQNENEKSPSALQRRIHETG